MEAGGAACIRWGASSFGRPTPRPVRYAFVLNPAARNRRAGRALPAIRAGLARRGVTATFALTEAVGHGTTLAASLAAAHDVVVAVGGDGTVQEVVRGLYGTDAALGILPAGTGNDFAHALGMPDPVEEGLDALLAAPLKPIDLGRVRWTEGPAGAPVEREGLFVNCLGAGYDGLVALGVPKYKWMGGKTAYVAAVLRALRLWKPPAAVATEPPAAGGAEPGPTAFDAPLFLVMICNGFSVGGGFLLTPDARPDDGRLDVCFVRGMPTHRVLRLLPMTFSGAHVGQPEVSLRRVERLALRAASPLPMQADGEILSMGAHTIEVEVLPAAMRALVPGRR